jgi:hypothetical protein
VPTQNCDFVPQRQQLDHDCRLAASQDCEPPEQAYHDQIQEAKTHGRRACLIPTLLQSSKSTGTREVLERYREPCAKARVKNRQVAARSRFWDISTSMTCLYWSIARYRYTSAQYIRLIDEPAIPRDVPAGSGRVDQQRSEPLHPAIHGDVIDRDATFG